MPRCFAARLLILATMMAPTVGCATAVTIDDVEYTTEEDGVAVSFRVRPDVVRRYDSGFFHVGFSVYKAGESADFSERFPMRRCGSAIGDEFESLGDGRYRFLVPMEAYCREFDWEQSRFLAYKIQNGDTIAFWLMGGFHSNFGYYSIIQTFEYQQ